MGGPLLIVMCFNAARVTWFRLYTYRLADGVLEASDPILKRCWTVRCNQVRRVRCISVYGRLRGLNGFGSAMPSQSERVWQLETASGDRIFIADNLALWPEVMRRCSEAVVEHWPARRQ